MKSAFEEGSSSKLFCKNHATVFYEALAEIMRISTTYIKLIAAN